MPAIDTRKAGDDEIEVLITGFGPWMGYKENPAWLSTRDLHDTYLSLETSPENESSSKEKEDDEKEKQGPRIHIQAIQCAVSYAHVLSLIPLIHGNNPSSPDAKPYLDPSGIQPDKETHLGLQGNGSPYPEGYDIKIPAKGRFDLLIHVGVGAKGGISIEKLAHKRGYQMPDVLKEHAPVCIDQSPSAIRISEAERGEKERLETSQKSESTDSSEGREGTIRGFGVGYENFDDELMTRNDVTGLVEWLQKEGKVKNIRQSLDAGRYLCDFINYCSLAERIRKDSNTMVQFIHVPPTDEPQSAEECKDAIQKVIWWLVCKNK